MYESGVAEMWMVVPREKAEEAEPEAEEERNHVPVTTYSLSSSYIMESR